MPTKVAAPVTPTSLRFTAAELEEIQEFVDRAGVRRSEFFRNTILARIREAESFSRSVPEYLDQIDLKVARLHDLVAHQAAIIKTLVGASMAQLAGAKDYGSMTQAEVSRRIDVAIRNALIAGPTIVDACLQQHPALHRSDDGYPNRME